MANLQMIAQELDGRCKTPATFGHLRYVEAPDDELVLLPNKKYMRIPAARAFLEMSIKAHIDARINLLPASCFRRHGVQREVFLKRAQKKNVGFDQNVKRVAPAGYSEHHTGYAVDIRDGPGPRQMQGTPFRQRPVYAWLVENAADFGFENSFPQGNVQGIIFEPWHWRWIANDHAERMFTTARKLVDLDKEDPRYGEAVRTGKDTGVSSKALPSVKKALHELFEAHGKIMEEEQERLEAFRNGAANVWVSAT